MKTIIRCHTLFDITKTGVLNRKTPINIPQEKVNEWELNRNRQSNFDTIIQVLSLRTQPEDITNPVKNVVSFKENNRFGFLYENEEDQPCWSFTFTINYKNAYSDGENELGGLVFDCDGVPMLIVDSTWDKISNFLDTSPELCNIYFEVITDEE